MLRRILLLAILLFVAAPAAPAQSWLDRYLRERKSPKAAQSTEPNAAANSGVEIRRAEPVDAAAPGTGEPVAPAEIATPSEAVRRAEPVTAEVSFDSVPVRRAEVVVPSPTPTPAPVATPAPRVVVKPELPPPAASPTAPPPAVSGTEAAAAPAQQSDEMDPNTSVVRIAPSNRPVPPEISQFQYANGFYAKKEYDHAASEYDRYLRLYPNGPDRQAALFRLAESHRQLQNFNAAQRAYEALLMDYVEGDFVGPAAYRMADICFQNKNYPDALAYYRKVTVRVKDPAILLSAKYYSARCNEALRASSEAIDGYQDVLAIVDNNPFREASRFALARLLADSGRRAEALAQFDTLIKETGKESLKAEATVRQGLLLLDMGKTEKAAAALKSALKMPELGSWREIAQVNLLRVFYNSQQYQQVLESYQASAAAFSVDAQPEVLLILANSNRQLGKDKAACALYEQIARDYPATPYARDAQYYRLIALYNAGAPDLIREVDTYLALNPEAGDKRDQLLLLKAESLYKAGNYAAAAPLYATVDTSRLPANLKAEALFKRGWCHTQTQPRDNPSAVQAFSAFLKEYPAHKLAPTALAQRAVSYQQSKNTKDALADFESILARYPQAAKERELALQQKALILGDREDYQGMADTFGRLLREFPASPRAGQAHYWCGWAAIEGKNYRKAIPFLEAARQLDKEHFGNKATLLLLQAYLLLEDPKALAAEVDKAPATETKVSPNILRWLGTEFSKAGDNANAEKYLSRLTAQEGADLQPEDWLILGSARTRLSKWAEAEQALTQYLGKVSEPSLQATGHLALAEAQIGARHLDDAQKSAEAALALQPEGRLNARGRMLSGDIAMARGDYPDAAKLYLSITLLFGDDPEITPKALAQAYMAYKKAADTTQAAKTLNELQSRYPEYPVPRGN